MYLKKLCCILLLAYSLSADAQTYNSSVNGNFIVYTMQSLTVTNKGGVIGFYTPNDYFNGVVSEHYTNIKVKSNANWIVSFSAQSTYFTALSKRASTDMPATVMGVKKHGHKYFKQLSTNSQKLSSGNRGSGSNKHDFDVDISFDPGFKYSGGLYSIGIVYTLTRK